MSTRAKKTDSENRRVIVDLSWPPWGHSVNSAIPKDTFLESPVKLTYPTIDRLCKQAFEKGPIIVGWKKDMSRAFLQVPLQPNSWSVMGIFWASGIYFNKSAVMGGRSSPYMCQRTTNIIRHIMANIEYCIFNYIDDFMSIDKVEKAWSAYKTLGNLLRDLGVQEAIDKAVAPTTIIEFLGIIFDLVRMLLFIAQEKLNDIKKLLAKWRKLQSATKKQVQSIAGKLQFISLCVKPGRVFILRLYAWIGTMQDGLVKIPNQVRKDLEWWDKYLDSYNGVSMMYAEPIYCTQHSFATDASMVGMGAFNEGKYICEVFPDEILRTHGINIAHLEMLALYLALKVWMEKIGTSKLYIECDNMAVVRVLQGQSAKDELLQTYLREITYLIATHNCEICINYIDTKSNKIPDMFSRYYKENKIKQEADRLITKNKWERTQITLDMYKLQHKW